jgi:LAO/AO transport system kinase
MSSELKESAFPQWEARLRAGERRTLARLLTYAESFRAEDGEMLGMFLRSLDRTSAPALRVGITGIPGAGKSTLIDALGAMWVARGLRVAVLAVDPSSVVSGGSVLGDKVRMTRLGASEFAFIRPVPSAGALGGVTVHLDECAQLCELAGYDRIIIETVGVGQSEVDVALICDVLTVVAVAGTGDELQAFKRGITEFADIVMLNKCDTLSEATVEMQLAMHREGMALVRGEAVSVLACSAVSDTGIEQWSQQIEARAGLQPNSRADKRVALFRRLLEHAQLRKFWRHVEASPLFSEIVDQVRREQLTLRAAIDRLLVAPKP